MLLRNLDEPHAERPVVADRLGIKVPLQVRREKRRSRSVRDHRPVVLAPALGRVADRDRDVVPPGRRSAVLVKPRADQIAHRPGERRGRVHVVRAAFASQAPRQRAPEAPEGDRDPACSVLTRQGFMLAIILEKDDQKEAINLQSELGNLYERQSSL